MVRFGNYRTIFDQPECWNKKCDGLYQIYSLLPLQGSARKHIQSRYPTNLNFMLLLYLYHRDLYNNRWSLCFHNIRLQIHKIIRQCAIQFCLPGLSKNMFSISVLFRLHTTVCIPYSIFYVSFVTYVPLQFMLSFDSLFP